MKPIDEETESGGATVAEKKKQRIAKRPLGFLPKKNFEIFETLIVQSTMPIRIIARLRINS